MEQNESLFEEYLKKARKYCSFSERCIAETEIRLEQIGASGEQITAIIGKLISEGFIDDKRFASIFARSKLNQNKWGKVKIRHELSARKIPSESIRAALDDLDERHYEETLKKIISQKISHLKGMPKGQIKEKTIAFCMGKGFEPDRCIPLIEKFLRTELL